MLKETSPSPLEILTPAMGHSIKAPSPDDLIDRRIYAVAIQSEQPVDLRAPIDAHPFAYTEHIKGIAADEAKQGDNGQPHVFLGRVGNETVYQDEMDTGAMLQNIREKVHEVRMRRAVLRGIKRHKRENAIHVRSN